MGEVDEFKTSLRRLVAVEKVWEDPESIKVCMTGEYEPTIAAIVTRHANTVELVDAGDRHHARTLVFDTRSD